MSESPGRLLLYAPSVHTGGGLVLLKELLSAWQAGVPLVAWLDNRARDQISLPPLAQVRWVRARVSSRLAAEWSLRRAAGTVDRVLCFHGLPPLLNSRARIEVFQQNINYFGNVQLETFQWGVRQRLWFEQALCRWRRHRVQRYWVQTPSMAEALRRWWGPESGRLDVQVLAFMPPTPYGDQLADVRSDHDFIYVADGAAHKNHRRLIEAWIHLAERGVRPSLALTLSPRDHLLQEWIDARSKQHGLRIHHLGTLPHSQLLGHYSRARALIFPSLGESFGLPLLEAQARNCPIVASERDFVRDVCRPLHTFDPLSSVSIARAVLRFLGQPEQPVQPVDGGMFLEALGIVPPRA